MEKSLKYYLSFFIGIALLFSCKKEEHPTGKTEARILAEKVFKEGAHLRQGSPKSMTRIQKAIDIDSTYDEAVRELSVAYLKRGMPHLWKKQYDKAVALNPEIWQPWRGYLYLWFYRDYKKAIADFDASDILTPNFTDTPQGHSVDYWRGIAYLGLKNYKKSIEYFDKNIAEDSAKYGEEFVEVTAFLYQGINYYELNDYAKAEENFNKLIKYSYGNYGDGKYYLAKIFKTKGRLKEAKLMAESALEDFKNGYVNQRPYVESMRELYIEDYQELINALNE